jgi:hypothetical protein
MIKIKQVVLIMSSMLELHGARLIASPAQHLMRANWYSGFVSRLSVMTQRLHAATAAGLKSPNHYVMTL